jgi:predicted neuraminidase
MKFAAAALTLASVTRVALAAGADGLTASEFIFESSTFSKCHASTIVETTSGKLVAAWFGGTAEGRQDVGIWVSRLEDGIWSAPVEVANGVQDDATRLPCWNPVLFQPSGGGELTLFYKVGPSPVRWWGMLRTSADDGQTWKAAAKLPKDILGPIKNKPVQLADGTILCGSSTEGRSPPPSWHIHFERSSDGAKTWQRVEVPTAPDEIASIQPTILIHAVNRLQALGRTRSGRIFTTNSFDGVQTWEPLKLTLLPNPNSGIDAVTLKDGRHLLVYNHAQRGRSPLNLAMTKDGAQWHAALVLESDPGEYSYPSIIQARDGLVHVTYTWKRQRVKHTVIDPTKLAPRLIVDGAWPE